ncbi:unnamed protein product [Cylicostephanus goldi]|uniref:Uncharacterized protein n=1 Tax=Cylicostephanus goldi TaxID=71465 RepID=A0A3P6TA40_CYLGO|nr:unnamed protein product [Cylicostephanus goldi]
MVDWCVRFELQGRELKTLSYQMKKRLKRLTKPLVLLKANLTFQACNLLNRSHLWIYKKLGHDLSWLSMNVGTKTSFVHQKKNEDESRKYLMKVILSPESVAVLIICRSSESVADKGSEWKYRQLASWRIGMGGLDAGFGPCCMFRF